MGMDEQPSGRRQQRRGAEVASRRILRCYSRRAAVLGEVSCLLAAVLVLPAALRWRARVRESGGVPLEPGRERASPTQP